MRGVRTGGPPRLRDGPGILVMHLGNQGGLHGGPGKEQQMLLETISKMSEQDGDGGGV